MEEQKKGGTKNKYTFWYVAGGMLVVIASAVVTYTLLSMLHDVQDSALSEAELNAKKTAQQSELPVNRAITATSHRDFGAVCGGFTVKNATPYTTKPAALIVTFSQSPRTVDSWSYEDVGYGKTYTRTDGDFTKINTVACLHEIRDTKVFSKMCTYDEDGESVSVRYYSIRYKLSYYEAKTGKRIADGGIIEAPAGVCPSFIDYDQQTLAAYATPENDVIDIAHSNFVAAH